MGRIANMRPDLWAAIIAAVPFVDVLNHHERHLPAARPAWNGPRWGAPAVEGAEQACDCIAGYSPYDNVESPPSPIRRAGHRRPLLGSARHLLGAGQVGGQYCAPRGPGADCMKQYRSKPPRALRALRLPQGGAARQVYAFAVWAQKGPS